MRIKKSRKKYGGSLGGDIAIFILLTVIGLFMLFPIYLSFVQSIKPPEELFLFPPKLYAMAPTNQNFVDLINTASNMWVPFSRYILNTLIITTSGMVGHVIIASVAAYDGTAAAIGYSLTEDDRARVYESLHRLGEKTGRKSITTRELDAIIAADALQVSPTYRLVSYLINSGNTITATAQITLDKNGELMTGLCAGDGPIDAAFRAIEQIIGYHYELDDFRISSVTEGKGAMGDALIRLRYEGMLYSGRGLSTDIIGAAIRAYVSALNKIVYDQNNSK